jgi:hypothetical protein
MTIAVALHISSTQKKKQLQAGIKEKAVLLRNPERDLVVHQIHMGMVHTVE